MTKYLVQAIYQTNDERPIKKLSEKLIPSGPRHWKFLEPAGSGIRKLILKANPYRLGVVGGLEIIPLGIDDTKQLVSGLLDAEPKPTRITIEA